MSKNVKIVVGVPETHAKAVRDAMAKAGAGLSDRYSHASFSTKGIGRFKPLEGSNPVIGLQDKLEEVAEEQITSSCPKENAAKIVEAIKQAHPYEEPVIDIIALENL
jgi:hypothetical protein